MSNALRSANHYPVGYGLHLFGALIPILSAPVLWILAVLDIAATMWAWRYRALWPVLVAGVIMSAYLTMVGVFSIGPIYFVLFVVQVARLVLILAHRRR